MDSIDRQYRCIQVKNLKGVGPRIADKLNSIGLFSLYDLFLNLPFRYLDKTRPRQVKDLKPDGSNQLIDVTVAGSRFLGQGAKVFQVTAYDKSGSLDLKFFNVKAVYAQRFFQQQRLQAFGAVKYDNYSGALTMFQPEVTFLEKNAVPQTAKTLSPIYHLTEGIAQRLMGKIEREALGLLAAQPLSELIPPKLLPEDLKLSFTDALLTCHYPAPLEDETLPKPEELPQFKRLTLEELTSYLLALRCIKSRQVRKSALPISCDDKLQERFVKSLPYTPTGAQSRVMREVCEDLKKDTPMLRLVNGDVGSGKTLIAQCAALHAAHSGLQTVLMAPTEILAKQHYLKCKAQLEPLGVRCALLSSKLSAAERRAIYKAVKTGEVSLIVGTLAVIQDKVEYAALGLVIIDEQHRFGVEQRSALMKKSLQGLVPHQLSLSATPIPRTLQLALFADLAVSRLDEMPAGRLPIKTTKIARSSKDKVIERLRFNLDKGVQAYWVCPLIEENEDLSVDSVKETFEELCRRLPHYAIGLLHGQMSTEKKNEVMESFAAGKIQLLVATTIIEVGVDVPNATIMVIDSVQRLGLAQLHQLRGRVGRGSQQSYCLMIYDEDSLTDLTVKRMEIMKSTADGFVIAAEDLKLRGPGDLAGTRQAGFDAFRLADAARDLPQLEDARRIADAMLNETPELSHKLIARWFPQYLETPGTESSTKPEPGSSTAAAGSSA